MRRLGTYGLQVAGRASAPAGEQGVPFPDRSQGPIIWGAGGGGQAEAAFGSDRHWNRQPPNLGKGRGHRPGLAHAQTRAGVRGRTVGRDRRRPGPGRRSRATTLIDRAQQPPGRARVGLRCTDGQCPRNVTDGLGPSCAGMGKARSLWTTLKFKVESRSRYGAGAARNQLL